MAALYDAQLANANGAASSQELAPSSSSARRIRAAFADSLKRPAAMWKAGNSLRAVGATWQGATVPDRDEATRGRGVRARMDLSGRFGQPMAVSSSIHHATTVLCLQTGRHRLTKLGFIVGSYILVVTQVYTICSIAINTLYNPCATGTAVCRSGMWCTDRLAFSPGVAEIVAPNGFGKCTACGGWDPNSVALVPQADFEATCVQLEADCGPGSNTTCDMRKHIECVARPQTEATRSAHTPQCTGATRGAQLSRSQALPACAQGAQSSVHHAPTALRPHMRATGARAARGSSRGRTPTSPSTARCRRTCAWAPARWPSTTTSGSRSSRPSRSSRCSTSCTRCAHRSHAQCPVPRTSTPTPCIRVARAQRPDPRVPSGLRARADRGARAVRDVLLHRCA